MSVFSLIPKLYFNLLGLGFLMGTGELIYDMATKADWARKHGQISLSALNHQLETGGRVNPGSTLNKRPSPKK